MNVPEKLAHELVRVTELRDAYRAMRGMPQVNVEAVIALLDTAIGQACAAAGCNDARIQIAALVCLEGFTE